MTSVELSKPAIEDLDELIASHSLPADTRARVARSLQPLARFPLLGPELEGRWSGYRFLLGPWRWMIIVYLYLADDDRAVVVTVQDGRSSRAVRSSGW